MLLIKTSAGESRLINPDYIVEIRPKTAPAIGSEITLQGDAMSANTIIHTDTPFGELARDLFTKRFVARV